MKGWYGLQVSQYCTIAKTRFSHDPSGAFGRKRHGGFAGKFNRENTIQETIKEKMHNLRKRFLAFLKVIAVKYLLCAADLKFRKIIAQSRKPNIFLFAFGGSTLSKQMARRIRQSPRIFTFPLDLHLRTVH